MLRGDATRAVTCDAVATRDTAVCRGVQVRVTKGHIGKVQGIVADLLDDRVKHVPLHKERLRGRSGVAMPIAPVTRVDDGIQLDLTKHEVEDLLSIAIDHTAR